MYNYVEALDFEKRYKIDIPTDSILIFFARYEGKKEGKSIVRSLQMLIACNVSVKIRSYCEGRLRGLVRG